MVQTPSIYPSRTPKFRMRLQNYGVNVKYKPGSKQFIADKLSRSPHSDSYSMSHVKEINAVSHIFVGEQRRERLLQETNCDETMKEVKNVITRGWPEAKARLLK